MALEEIILEIGFEVLSQIPGVKKVLRGVENTLEDYVDKKEKENQRFENSVYLSQRQAKDLSDEELIKTYQEDYKEKNKRDAKTIGKVKELYERKVDKQ